MYLDYYRLVAEYMAADGRMKDISSVHFDEPAGQVRLSLRSGCDQLLELRSGKLVEVAPEPQEGKKA